MMIMFTLNLGTYTCNMYQGDAAIIESRRYEVFYSMKRSCLLNEWWRCMVEICDIAHDCDSLLYGQF